MKTSAIERYTKLLVAARNEYDRAMEATRREASLAAIVTAPAAARDAADRMATAAVDNYVKALREARRGYASAMEAAAKASRQ